MQNVKQAAKRLILISLAAVLFIGPTALPLAAFAEDCVTAEAPKGTSRPVGADADTYTYNSCGYWENTYYTWSPTSRTASPKDQPTYTYNQATKKWDAKVWRYSPASNGWYQSNTSVDQPPAGAPTQGGPVAEPPAATPTAASSDTPSGGSSTNTTSSNDQTTNTTTNSGLTNQIDSTAITGNAGVFGNTNAGSAMTGNAQAIANVFNMLQSSSSAGANVATFVTNIDGDVQGDLLIDPNFLQPTSDVTKLTNNVDFNISNNGVIDNDITLRAASGDATVAKNTNAGDATTGNATAIANVVNMMNSLIASNQSFLGVVNINGNFNGNILMPQSFLDQLIASNAPSETVNVSQTAINNLTANLSNNDNITNDVTSRATSGAASVSENTHAGSATTGSANTNVTIFNLTNHHISAGNSMLVFVNVVGKWVGVIMDAPAGSTAAAFGGGVTASTIAENNVNVNAQNNGSIRNTIDVAAASGDATVERNTHAGNAISGDAKTAVNIANITNSGINLTGWFGILFINVFGNWNGNFGVATTVPGDVTGGRGADEASVPAMFGFVPTSVASAASRASNSVATGQGSTVGSGSNSGLSNSELTGLVNNVLGASVSATPKKNVPLTTTSGSNTLLLLGGGLVLAGILIAAVDRRRYR